MTRIELGEYLTTCSVTDLHDAHVGKQEVVAGHAWAPGDACGYDYDVGVGGWCVVVGAGDLGVGA